MSATGLTTDAIKNVAANAYAGAGLYVTVLKALTLGSGTTVGAASFTVDLSVAAGDILVFEQGTSSQEQITVQSVSGSGPYTVVPATTLTKAHTGSAKIAHIPLTSATVHELTVTRVAANWGSPSPAGVITTAAGAITVPSSSVVGSLALFSASTAGTYYDATAVTAQTFTASGSYTPVWVETFS
jgi:hypothetical protein